MNLKESIFVIVLWAFALIQSTNLFKDWQDKLIENNNNFLQNIWQTGNNIGCITTWDIKQVQDYLQKIKQNGK